MNVKVIEKRLTIGFLSDNAAYESENEMLLGAIKAAEEYDINLVYISHLENNEFRTTMHFSDIDQKIKKHTRSKYDKLKDAINQLNIDGLMFVGWSKDYDGEKIKEFENAIQSVPLFSLGKDFKNIPCVYMHGGDYIKALYSHLVEIHNCSHIAFVSPWNSDSRIDNFKDIMTQHNHYDEELIVRDCALHGLDGFNRVKKALTILFNDRKKELDAIMVMTAEEGRYLLQLLQQRGISVPHDVKIVCYEDHPAIAYSKPSLTTVDFPFNKIGYYGCLQLYNLLTTGKAPLITEVDTNIIFRDSCGCIFNEMNELSGDKFNYSLQTIDEILVEIEHSLCHHSTSYTLPYLKLSYLFLSDIENDEGQFLIELQSSLSNMNKKAPKNELINMIETLRKKLLPLYYNDSTSYTRGEKLWYCARYIIRDYLNQSIITHYIKSDRDKRTLSIINQSLLSAHSMDKIISTLDSSLKELEIPTCFLLLHDEKMDRYEVKFSYYNNEQYKIEETGLKDIYETFANRKGERFTIVFMLHHLSQDQSAMLLMEPTIFQGNLIMPLGVQISAAVKGASLFEQSQSLINKLSYFADTDTLTGLSNRRFLYESLESATTHSSPFSIFYIDIDGFKLVNDSHGHDMGDKLLKAISKRIICTTKSYTYPLDIHRDYQFKPSSIFRIGGDEFVILINSNDHNTLVRHAEELVDNISNTYMIENIEIKVSCSIGISTFPRDSTAYEELLKRADSALYAAKTKKNSFRFYNELTSYS